MIYLVVGNIVALIGSLLMVYTGIIKEKKKIILVQTIQIAFLVASNLILGGITGAIINAISCIRNIICYKDKLKTKEKIILVLLSTSLSLYFNNLGIIGLLPLISTVSYTLLMDLKDVVKFKILIIFTLIMWIIYDIYIKSYSSATFDFLNIITNMIAIYELKIVKYKNKEDI